jgi:hypothetical protein
MLKYAGWDGIVVEGKADKPVWIDIRNDKVRIKDAGLNVLLIDDPICIDVAPRQSGKNLSYVIDVLLI